MSAPIILTGDCVEVMRTLPPESVHAVVTDPPYGLEFMGEDWDSPGRDARGLIDKETWGGDSDAEQFARAGVRYGLGQAYGAEAVRYARALQEWHAAWLAEALRVLVPGGFLVAFSGTRTYHRLACAAEDVGFEVRDMLEWFYGSGFPKSHNVSVAIDKHLGREDERVAVGRRWSERYPNGPGGTSFGVGDEGPDGSRTAERDVVTRAATPEAAEWEGWGTALKPAHEPILLARKPVVGTVAANVLRHGAGGLNVAAGIIGTTKDVPASPRRAEQGPIYSALNKMNGDEQGFDPDVGRWPANLILSHGEDCLLVGARTVKNDGHFPGASTPSAFQGGFEGAESVQVEEQVVGVWECEPGCPVAILDAQSGDVGAFAPVKGTEPTNSFSGHVYGKMGRQESAHAFYADKGGASRFFYVAKASRAERNAGLDDFEELMPLAPNGSPNAVGETRGSLSKPRANFHPTVKPIDIMRWLVRIVSPPGGLILDPFLGSGTTAIAAALEGIDVVGIERGEDYVDIAAARIRFWLEHGEAGFETARGRESSKRRRAEVEERGQLDLFAAADPA